MTNLYDGDIKQKESHEGLNETSKIISGSWSDRSRGTWFNSNPFAVKANTTSSSPLIVAQASNRDSFGQRLGLTDEQKAKIKEIHENTHAEVAKILTPDQQTQLKTPMQNHQGWRRAIDSLNFTEDKKTNCVK